MKYIFVALGMLIQLIFLFKREWLFEKKSVVTVGFVSIALFLTGFLLKKGQMGDPRFVVLLENPLLSLVIFLLMKSAYGSIFGKNPVDTFWSGDFKLMKDGLFNFLFWVVGGAGPVILTFYLRKFY